MPEFLIAPSISAGYPDIRQYINTLIQWTPHPLDPRAATLLSLPQTVRNSVFRNYARLRSCRAVPNFRADFGTDTSLATHPLWQDIMRCEASPPHFTQFCTPVSSGNRHHIEGLSSVQKALFEQRRMDNLTYHWQSFELAHAADALPLHGLSCECMGLGGETPTWPDSRSLTPKQNHKFLLALAFLHQEFPHRCLQRSGLNLSQWFGALARDPQTLEAAATFVIAAHGAVICPASTTEQDLRSVPSPQSRAEYDDPDEIIISEAARSGVEKGTHILLSLSDIPSASVPFVNGSFVVHQTDKDRVIVNSKRTANTFSIPRSIQYPTVSDHLASLTHPSTNQCKSDVHGAYGNLLLRRDNQRFNCTQAYGSSRLDPSTGTVTTTHHDCLFLYVNRSTPFGSTQSPAMFTALTCSIIRLCIANGYYNTLVYVDDMFGSDQISPARAQEETDGNTAASGPDAHATLKFLTAVCEALGVPLAPHKSAAGPDLTILGLEISQLKNLVYRSKANASKIIALAQAAQLSATQRTDTPGTKGRHASRLEVLFTPLEQLVNAAQWSIGVVPLGRAHLDALRLAVTATRRRYSASPRRIPHMAHAQCSSFVKEDLHFNIHVAPLLGGINIRPKPRRETSSLDIGCDAFQNQTTPTIAGYGIQFHNIVICGVFPPSLVRTIMQLTGHTQVIAFLEMWTVCRLIELFGPSLKGLRVRFAEDNLNTTSWVNTGHSRTSAPASGMCKSLGLMCRRHDIELFAVDTRSALNKIPDAASRVLAHAVNASAAMTELIELMRDWRATRSPGSETDIRTDTPVFESFISPESRHHLLAELGLPLP